MRFIFCFETYTYIHDCMTQHNWTLVGIMPEQETPITHIGNPSFSSPVPVFRSVTMMTGTRNTSSLSYGDMRANSCISELKQTEHAVANMGLKDPVVTREKRSNLCMSERKQTEDPVVNMGWKHPVLTRVGCFYPISHTHRTFPKLDLKFILERLTCTFHLLNLHTTFYDALSVQACCRSMEQVELAVNIWECRDEPDFIVLEIQRISGDTIIYSKYVKSIFSELCRKEVTGTATDECSRTSTCSARDKMEVIMRSLPSPPVNIAQETLDIVLKMLLSDRRDARCHGLELLVFLTDTSKTDIAMATDVAKALLLGFFESSGNTLLMDQRIQGRIFHLALLGKWPDSITAAAGELCCDEGPHVYLALMALANAINILNASPDLLLLVLDAASHVGGDSFFIITMEKYIRDAHNNPHAAYLAARILTSLYRAQGTFVRCGLQLDAVRAAQQIGHHSHAALEMVTGQLLSALEA